ncbi:DISARM system helicase DrmA [Methylobacterium soli]|uniref:Helicase C-terminal domain-containing protein n=1 Tax=Methylobacterium soli TaxID=553447 RepID=A0A6L3SXN0_9HYPH|nr:DISARM system helicase DrmA [Methylobacterium soli]KAB1077857.1 hypothetical protein F6X53_16710 [Methylobacterium soli]GJE42624.1 hypothetical protein AEGHOMDF_1796 [Methylobacterium soli]
MTATTPLAVRGHIVKTFRRDLVGPSPDDIDLSRERLSENPSRWYLTGFLAPADDAATLGGDADTDEPGLLDEADHEGEEPDPVEAGGAAADRQEPEASNTRRRFLPSTIGLTVLLPPDVREVEAIVTWGDYATVPPLPDSVLLGEPETDEDGKPKRRRREDVNWVRAPKERRLRLVVPEAGRATAIVVPESAAEQAAIGGLELDAHARLFSYETPDGGREEVRALTVVLVNRRRPAGRFYADVAFAFQARLRLICAQGLRPRRDLSGLKSADPDLRLADLHYRDVCEWAVGRNTAARWEDPAAGSVTWAETDPLPSAEVERVAPNEDDALKQAVVFGMDDLAEAARNSGSSLAQALGALPELYDAWVTAKQRVELTGLPDRRRATAATLVTDQERARDRIAEGIGLLTGDGAENRHARTAFRLMNAAVAEAARRRNSAHAKPAWRPFQLAFILLNLAGLTEKAHPDRAVADLLFFPTGGGKTEAYLGLAAYTIAHRRVTGSGLLGAGVAVIMRYTLRLLTLDQLARAAGVVCALELMRTDGKHLDEKDRPLLGDWPIEIGLWVGSDASPNRLGGKGDKGDDTAVGRVADFRKGKGKAPAPLKACPWCSTPFTKNSFACVPNDTAPTNLELRCDNLTCDFSGSRALPVLTVDEPIYRRLPAFLIATVDKFASLPWEGRTGAFFGHVDRFDATGFYGAAEPRIGRRLDNGWSLDPPDLVIQDELHLISGPLGTVAGLYETAIDALATRVKGETRVRPKIVASTATVRRAGAQIKALFDRDATQVFPPPGVNRTDSFFARTVSADVNPARLYLGLAAQGRGPKLVYLRALTTLLAAAQSAYAVTAPDVPEGKRNPADPYMTALCYFNALRELGGARRIVEDEVRKNAASYGRERRRQEPPDQPFADRPVREPMELTSRVSTDEVAAAKQRLEAVFGGDEATVDVALATNMISVGLDITRLGLMLVQGQPKTAAEYIQATSRVGRDHDRPGLVVAILNLHKPRDRMHFEQFGHFHRTFYRAVEATSVTPWAARALDRALAAVVVAAARHLDPMLTPNEAVVMLRDQSATRAAVCDTIVARAPEAAVPGGRAALRAQVEGLLEAWIATVDAQTASGVPFGYAQKKSPGRLLHMPLERDWDGLEPAHKQFQANRSMRDVEPAVLLKVRDRNGHAIANADDV